MVEAEVEVFLPELNSQIMDYIVYFIRFSIY